MKKKLRLLLCTFVMVVTLATAQETYSKIAVDASASNTIDTLMALGLAFDHYETLANGTIAFYVTQEERTQLEVQGINYNLLIPDFGDYYTQLLINDAPKQASMQRTEFTASGFDLGTMGGFYTLAEMEDKLDEMFADYPTLITEKVSVGTTFEGRDIWMVKISDNPNIDEDEPVAYFDALHHSREPLAMATTINYMFWLLEHYETDDAVRYLVDHRELYFVPIVNPDGYEYNRFTNPDGGGLWRKNRQTVTGSSCIGIDLNRNYSFEFANNNDCSSPDPCSNIYRGEAAFSEAESAAVRDLMASINPNTAFSTHSTAGSYLMPYGFDVNPPAFDIYSEWASDFLSENNYPYGVTFQMLGYTTCGTTRDYMHSENIYGWTPEIDGQGFWPPPSTIFDLVGENVYPLYYQSWISGGYVDVQSHQVIGEVTVGETFALVTEIKNTGLDVANDVTVEVESLEADVVVSPSQSFGSVAERTRADNSGSPFQIEILNGFSGEDINLTITVRQGGAINKTLALTLLVSEKQSLFFDDAESGGSQWISSGNNINWSVVTDDSYSGTQCFGDSDGGNAQNNTNNYFELDTAFDFTDTTTPYVSFMYKHSLDAGDVVELQISTDNGSSWEAITNFTLSERWKQHQNDVSAYNGFDAVRFRFYMFTNGFIPGDGFYFDDFEVANYITDDLATEDFSSSHGLLLYPNPTQEVLTIKNLTTTSLQAAMLDIQGRTVKSPIVVSPAAETQIPTAILSKGLYFMMVTDGSGQTQTLRFIKE